MIVAIANGLMAAGLVVLAGWLVWRAGWQDGHAQGYLDAKLDAETDEHERSFR